VFVVLEGIDGSGKSTQLNLVADRLRRDLVSEKKVETVKFPIYDSPTGTLIQKLLKSGLKTQESTLLFQSLMAINRQEFFANYKFSDDTILLSDRYILSGLVYGLAQGLDRDWLESINCWLPLPDATIFIDIRPEDSFKRRPVREDCLEGSVDFMNTIYDVYRQNLPLGTMIIDGNRTVDFVTSEIMNRICLVNDSLIYRF